MNKTSLLFALVASASLLSACSKESSPPPAATPAAQSQAASVAAIAQDAKGFTVGPAMAAHTVYVFFDAQCPHCSQLWYASKPIKSAKFVWLPVRLLNDNSETQGAAILASKDAPATMDEHEASMMDRKGGIQPQGDIAAQRAAVKKNTELFNQYGFASVPTLVTQDASGKTVTHEGALPTAELAAFAGVPAPAQ